MMEKVLINTILNREDMPRGLKGQFLKGISYSLETQFKKGQHWRVQQPFWNRDFLIQKYVIEKKSALEIAIEFNCTDANIIYFLEKFGIKRRTTTEIRKIKKWGLKGEKNPMWKKNGDLNPNWKGGITPERQEFYQSQEWKRVCYLVWKRDCAMCQRCKIQPEMRSLLHIHHMISFKNKELRVDSDNLILLCRPCHSFVHSKKNRDKEFIGKAAIPKKLQEVRNDRA